MIAKTFRETLGGLYSLVVGLSVTGTNLFRPKVTYRYPWEASTLEGFRGPVELVPSEEDPLKPKCNACGNCVRICPTSCLSMKATKPKKKEASEEESSSQQSDSGEKKEAKKAKPELQSFFLDFTYCSQCGLCVQNCPVSSLRFSTKDAYLAGFSRQDFVFDLLAKLKSQAQQKEQ